MKPNLSTVAVAALLLTTLVACGNKPEMPRSASDAHPAPTSMPREETPALEEPVAAPANDDQELRLNDEFVSPDAGSQAVSEEESPAPQFDAIDPHAGAATEVKFVPSATTNLFITRQQLAYARQIDEHNEGLFERRVEAQAAQALEAKTDTTSAVAPAPPAVTAAQPTPTPPAPPIDEQKILEDKRGQWATSASASSSYGQATQPKECSESCRKSAYSPWQATGAPNVARYADDPSSWTPRSGDGKDPEWLEVGFAKAVYATSIRIRQNAAPGVISRIELIDEAKVAHTIWEGTDDTPYPKNTIGWLVKDIPRTSYRVRAARITLLPARVWGSNEIDAVQLVGE